MQRDELLSQVETLRTRVGEMQRTYSEAHTEKILKDIGDTIDELAVLRKKIAEENSAVAGAREAADRKMQRYQNLFELAPDAYVVTDRRGVVRDANQSAAALFGISRNALIGRHLPLHIRNDTVNLVLAGSSTANPRRLDFETRLRKATGEVVDVLISAAPGGDADSVLWLARNISERKETDQRLRNGERLATMGATALLLIREISNPLNAMFTTIQRLQRSLQGGDGLHSTLQELSQETGRLRALMQKFRSFSQPIQSRPQSIDLSGMIAELIALEKEECGGRGIDVKQLFLEKPLEVTGDYERLQQAFGNIIRNALEAMPQGGRLTVRGFTHDDTVAVEVMDTGTGVPKEIDVFNLFTTTKFQALGLGLPVARQTVTDHGGMIRYASIGGRTVFRVVLPLARPPSKDPHADR